MTERSYARHLQILLLLRSKQVTAAVELANRFKVSIRTIYRDIELMLEAGIPVQALPGRSGGFRLVTEDPLESTAPDPDLAFRLYLLGFWNPDTSSEEGISQRAGGARAFRSAFLRLIGRVHFDTADWYWRDEGSAHLRTVRTALQANTMLEMTFKEKGTDDRQRRFVKPLGLVWKAGQWYLVAAQMGDEIKRVSLNSIELLQATDATFSYPDDFRLKEWWAQKLESFGGGPTKVVLRVSANARDELARLSLKADSQVEIFDDGSMLITLFVDRWEWLIPLVASYGEHVVVEEPEQLVAGISAHLREALECYQGVPRPSDPQGTATFRNDDSRLRATRGRPQT